MAHMENIASMLASHPQFIALAYRLIENEIKKSNIPKHTYGVIGGAAGIVHRYKKHKGDISKTMASLDENTKTTDIDLTLWYHKRLNKSEFLEHTKRLLKRIEYKFLKKIIVKKEPLTKIDNPLFYEWKYIIEQLIRRELDADFDIVCEVQDTKRYSEMTGKINIIFIMYGKRFKLIELVIHNMLYSQERNPDFTERLELIAVKKDVTYLDNTTTELIPIDVVGDDVEIRVPTIDKLLQQLYLVYGNTLLDAKPSNAKESDEKSDDLTKYIERIKYLLQYGSAQCRGILCYMEHNLELELHKRSIRNHHKIRQLHCSNSPRSATRSIKKASPTSYASASNSSKYYGLPRKGGTRKR